MSFHHSQPMRRQHRYPWLSIFDVTLNVLLCSGVLAFACALVAVIIARNSPHLIAQVSQVAAYFLT